MMDPPVDTKWSRSESRRYAAMSPRPIPTTKLSSSPVPTENSVHGSTERMIDVTPVPDERNELPRSKCSRFQMNERYCSWIGALRLIAKRLDAIARSRPRS